MKISFLKLAILCCMLLGCQKEKEFAPEEIDRWYIPPEVDFEKEWTESWMHEGSIMISSDLFGPGVTKNFSIHGNTPKRIGFSVEKSSEIESEKKTVILRSLDFDEFWVSSTVGAVREIPERDGLINFSVTNLSSIETRIIIYLDSEEDGLQNK